MRALALLLLGTLLAAEGPEAQVRSRLAQTALAYAQSHAEQGAGETVLRLVKVPELAHLRGDVAFTPSHLSKSQPVGTFFVALKATVNGRPAGLVRVDLEGRWQGTLLRARTALARKSVPSEDQLEAHPFEGTPPPGALTAFPEGFRLRIPVGVGKVLTRADLEPIPLVATGEPVRVTLAWEPLTITAEATARSQGCLGDTIRVELPTRRTILAKVTGPGQARVDWSRP
ncbi:MAG TPA: flagellar basal body P-ring formation chaperone FlgA [Holophaga sp.]|jgi:flagella basal body P-ring formation protein FlgA|nr:flagellar basal body P-ring formation chaperone FlgA [Holophaga sp.]